MTCMFREKRGSDTVKKAVAGGKVAERGKKGLSGRDRRVIRKRLDERTGECNGQGGKHGDSVSR